MVHYRNVVISDCTGVFFIKLHVRVICDLQLTQ